MISWASTSSTRDSKKNGTDTKMKIRANSTRIAKGPRSTSRKRRLVFPLMFVALAPLLACDELLEAELPGQVTDDALNAPELAETLVAGAQADFECGFQGHLLGVEAGFANVFQYVIFQIEMIQIANRQPRLVEYGQGECTSNRDPIWFLMQRGRAQAADAARRIQEEMDPTEVDDLNFLVGKAYAYEGYATQILSEAWCEMVFDGSGETVTRADGMARAEARFDLALMHSQLALSGARAAEAQDIIDLALVGRARSRLNQGKTAGALLDAAAVTPGFIYYSTHETSPSRRAGMVERLEDGFNVHPRDRALMVGGIPDPRVPVENIGPHSSSGVGDWWVQRKYADDGSDLPIASWREARLIIAELDPAQSVAIINELRTNPAGLHSELDTSDWPLATYVDAGGPANALAVLEERRRELYLQGVQMGDDQRTGNFVNWDTGTSPVNAPIGTLTCLPLPEVEFF
jgi:hypothetical protein